MHHRDVTPFSCGSYRSPLLSVWLAKKTLKVSHVLSLVDNWCHYQMSSFKVSVCTKNVIPFDTITASEIVCPPDLETPAPFQVGRWDRIWVLRGHMDPSSWRRFPWGRFCQSPCRIWRYVVASLGTVLDRIMSTDTLLVTIRLAAPLWRFYFYCPIYDSASSEEWLVFAEYFGHKRLFLGGTHHWGGNCRGYA